ncbi:MAG: carbohydrate-binding protein, partial [Thermomicrobiales bacterium]
MATMTAMLALGLLAGLGGPQSAAAAPGVVALPGTFELEDYTSYYDTTRGNSGKTYRNDDVDIQECADLAAGGACYSLGWVKPGEWLGFDVTVATGGTFTFTTRVATTNAGRSVNFEVDGVDVTGPLAVPVTGGMQTWASMTSNPVAISAGAHSLRLVANGSSFNLNFVTVEQVTTDAPPAPEVPVVPEAPEPSIVTLPGTFQVEDYATYADTTAGNSGQVYRDDDVDIEACNDTASVDACYDIGWVKPGEWLGYDVTLATGGTFTFATRVATPNNNRSFHFEVDGADLTGPIEVPNTGGFQAWATVT